MKATLLGTEVNSIYFLAVAILIVGAQIAIWGVARRIGLVHPARKLGWTKSRVAACVSMAILSSGALFVGFLAFVASFAEQWQALWAIAAALVVAGLLGLATIPRFLFR
jgi:hypothetical protein